MPKPDCERPYRRDVTRIEDLTPVHRAEDGELVGWLSTERRGDADVVVARTLFGTALRVLPDRPAAASSPAAAAGSRGRPPRLTPT